MSVSEIQKQVEGYVENQRHRNAKVFHSKQEQSYDELGFNITIWNVKTDNDGAWWVAQGDLPMNLYPQDRAYYFSIDEVFSFHLGLMLRLINDDENLSNSMIDFIASNTEIVDNLMKFRRHKLIPLEEIRAITETAHACGLRVSAHITRARHLALAIEGGVDDVAHMIVDNLPTDLVEKMIERNMFWVATLELWSGVSDMYNLTWDVQAIENLRRFVAAGGQAAIGTDYAGHGCEFELGMPLKEMKLMQMAGMTPMQIIQAGTRNAAQICGLKHQGTLEPRNIADLLVVDGDPLKDLTSLKHTYLVIYNGERIR